MEHGSHMEELLAKKPHILESHARIIELIRGRRLSPREHGTIDAQRDRLDEHEEIKVLGNLALVETIADIDWGSAIPDLHLQPGDAYLDLHALPADEHDATKNEALLERSLKLVAEYIHTHKLQEKYRYIMGITYPAMARLASKGKFGFSKAKLPDPSILPPGLMEAIEHASKVPDSDTKRRMDAPWVVYRETQNLLHDPHYDPARK